MLSSSSSSRCLFKKSYKQPKTISLDSLPNELLIEISSCVASSSLHEVNNLQLVSKSFRNFCNDHYVYKRISLNEVPLIPWHDQNREKFSRFFTRCLKNGNPEAIYRKGLVDFFRLDNTREYGGIRYLAEAAKRGNREAIYVYGMIVICLGCKEKQKKFNVLSSLVKTSMSSTMKDMETIRKTIRDKVMWRGKPMMRQLKIRYVRDNCDCDGRTTKFLRRNDALNEYGENDDMTTSSACGICLWDHEAKLFFEDV